MVNILDQHLRKCATGQGQHVAPKQSFKVIVSAAAHLATISPAQVAVAVKRLRNMAVVKLYNWEQVTTQAPRICIVYNQKSALASKVSSLGEFS